MLCKNRFSMYFCEKYYAYAIPKKNNAKKMWRILKTFHERHLDKKNTMRSGIKLRCVCILALFTGILVSCTNELTPKRQTMRLDSEWMNFAPVGLMIDLWETLTVPFEVIMPERVGNYLMKAEYTLNEKRDIPVKQPLYLFIGTYTSGTSTGIYVYRFDEETGEATYVSEVKAVNPSYLAVSIDRRFVYSVSESGRDAAIAYAFTFDEKAGVLSLLNSQPTKGAAPCYISADPSGRFVVTANYSGGNVSVFPLADDGSLLPAEKVFDFEGSGPDAKRQDMPHLHCAVFSPDARYLFAADLGTDRLHKFTTSGTTPFLTTGSPEAYSLEPGSGPRHLTFHPNGKYAYLINELSGKVTVFRYSEGQLEPVQYIASDMSEGIGDKGSADIHVSPDGKFLYASNRANTNDIAIFSIHATDGRLSLVGQQPTGLHPRNFIITPNGKYLLTACQNSNRIQIFAIERQTGLLKEDEAKQITDVDRPVCLKFSNYP